MLRDRRCARESCLLQNGTSGRVDDSAAPVDVGHFHSRWWSDRQTSPRLVSPRSRIDQCNEPSRLSGGIGPRPLRSMLDSGVG